MFRGEKGGSDPNEFGWTWTEIVGKNSIYGYPLAMDASIETQNRELEEKYGCHEYGLTGPGLLESTATPFVYKGKMYLGTFDNATSIQAVTVNKGIAKLKSLMELQRGPTLSQIFAPIYFVMSHPQRVWVMDQNENISAVNRANELLSGTTNDYVWRFIEHEGKLYAGTFDSSSAYSYYLGLTFDRILSGLDRSRIQLPERIRELLDGSILQKISAISGLETKDAASEKTAEETAFIDAVNKAVDSLEKFYQNEYAVEDILDDMESLRNARDVLYGNEKSVPADGSLLSGKAADDDFGSLKDMIDTLLNFFDIDGLRYWIMARSLAKNTRSGFDLMVTEDGNSWKLILNDGLKDIYNYGARTFVVHKGDLYLGTANPYFGAQLWKVKGPSAAPDDPVPGFDFFRIDDCLLPNTGFSSRHFTNLALMPDGFAYSNLDMLLQIPSLNVQAAIVEIPRVEKEWPVEWLGANAGMLSGGSLPGQGYSVIAAHNTLNDTEYGPFAALSTIEENDRILVRDSSGDLINFSVYANELVDADGFAAIGAVAEKEPGSLILFTCENESVDGDYLNRRVIFAKPIRN